jgi:hypothetical protein
MAGSKGRICNLGKGEAMRIRRRRLAVLGALALTTVAAGCGGDDDESAEQTPPQTVVQASSAGITEDELPEGFSRQPSVTLDGKRWKFDNVPGHYWKVLDDRGYAMGLHFQTDKPFKWAQDAEKGQLLYIVYAVPGNCGNGNFNQAVKSKNATIQGAVPGGFDHWHAVVGGKSKTGHWLMHIPVRDFKLAGPPGNPMSGTQITRGTPKFMPVCDIR